MGAARAVPAGQLPLPPALPAAAGQLLDQARRGLAEAAACPDPRQRYATAHLACPAGGRRRAGRPHPARAGPRRPRSAWVLLGQVAPELGEWATFFAAGAAKRAAAEAGSPGRSPSGRPTTSSATSGRSSPWWRAASARCPSRARARAWSAAPLTAAVRSSPARGRR